MFVISGQSMIYQMDAHNYFRDTDEYWYFQDLTGTTARALHPRNYSPHELLKVVCNYLNFGTFDFQEKKKANTGLQGADAKVLAQIGAVQSDNTGITIVADKDTVVIDLTGSKPKPQPASPPAKSALPSPTPASKVGPCECACLCPYHLFNIQTPSLMATPSLGGLSGNNANTNVSPASPATPLTPDSGSTDGSQNTGVTGPSNQQDPPAGAGDNPLPAQESNAENDSQVQMTSGALGEAANNPTQATSLPSEQPAAGNPMASDTAMMPPDTTTETAAPTSTPAPIMASSTTQPSEESASSTEEMPASVTTPPESNDSEGSENGDDAEDDENDSDGEDTAAPVDVNTVPLHSALTLRLGD